MSSLVPYFTFPGNCREAMHFYKECLNGEILQIQTFGEAGMRENPQMIERILHAEVKAGEILLMASDGMPDFNAQSGNTLSLNINLSDPDEQTRIFNALARGGSVSMPLQDTFWGARYGMLTDQFGIQWMLNCPQA